MSALRIDVSDLLTHPGARRSVHLEDEVEDLRGSAASVTGPISLDLTLEHIADGVVVRGRLGATWRGECSVCLRDLEEPLDVVVDELFESDPVEGETYPLEGHEIDLEQLVRDSLVVELPLAPHCAEPCAAPVIDEDNEDQPKDPRWAVLEELKLD